jgi:hypothetical protein
MPVRGPLSISELYFGAINRWNAYQEDGAR